MFRFKNPFFKFSKKIESRKKSMLRNQISMIKHKIIYMFKKLFSRHKETKIARYLALRTSVNNKPAEYHFHVIFTRTGGHWIGDTLEYGPSVTDMGFEACRSFTIENLLLGIRSMERHGFPYERVFNKPSHKELKKWKKLRRKEGLDPEPYINGEFRKLEEKDRGFPDAYYAWDI